MIGIATEHEYEFLPYNSAYLQKSNSPGDLHLKPEEYRDKNVTQEDIKE